MNKDKHTISEFSCFLPNNTKAIQGIMNVMDHIIAVRYF